SINYMYNDIRVDTILTLYNISLDTFASTIVTPANDFFNPAIKRGRNRIPKMQKRVLLESDVDKHRLQSHLDVSDFSLVDAADDIPRGATFDAIFLQPAVF